MPRTVTITLGEQEYEIPRLNVGQIEDLAPFWDLIDDDKRAVDEAGKPLAGRALTTRNLQVAAIALRRAAPAIADVRELECTLGELVEAVLALLRFSNPKKKAETAGEAPAGDSPAA
jgi:hypothetical protein